MIVVDTVMIGNRQFFQVPVPVGVSFQRDAYRGKIIGRFGAKQDGVADPESIDESAVRLHGDG